MSQEIIKFGGGFLGNKLVIKEKHIEITQGCFPFKRKRIIPISSITNVEKPQFLSKVIIHTKDGKKVDFSMGNPNKIQEAILQRME